MTSTPPARIIARVITRLFALLLVAAVGWGVVELARAVTARPPASEGGHGNGDVAPDIPDGLRRSGTPASGQFRTASLTIPPTHHRAKVNRYTVRVETSLSIDANAAAREIERVLDDGRGWVGTRTRPSAGNSFELVGDATRADFTITIATPATVDALCPLDTGGVWSCDDGAHILLNSDRWLYRTPIYSDTAAYRAYMVNHEVGHYLGLGHSACAAPGHLAPVMMQQSKGLDGCRPNPWPTLTTA